MEKYEILEHKADLRIKVFGRTEKELFQNALLGMAESMKPETRKSAEKMKRKIEIKSLDVAALLVDFLSEVLYQSQVNKEVYNEVRFINFSDRELAAEISGQKVERFGEDIKAVTHHNLEIKQTTDKTWEATIIFDV